MDYPRCEERATMNNLSNDFEAALREVRSNPGMKDEFQKWVRAHNESLSNHLSQGVYLRLARGDIEKVMSSVAALLPGCSHCERICSQGAFDSRSEQHECERRVDAALQGGDLRRVKRPVWFNPHHSQLGSDGYFECVTCGSVWTLVEPERQDNGLWERIS